MKQETLEEAAKYYAHNHFEMHETNNYKALKQGFEAGAKLQEERMYSKDEVIGLLYKREHHCEFTEPFLYLEIEEWFKQFKKK